MCTVFVVMPSVKCEVSREDFDLENTPPACSPKLSPVGIAGLLRPKLKPPAYLLEADACFSVSMNSDVVMPSLSAASSKRNAGGRLMSPSTL